MIRQSKGCCKPMGTVILHVNQVGFDVHIKTVHIKTAFTPSINKFNSDTLMSLMYNDMSLPTTALQLPVYQSIFRRPPPPPPPPPPTLSVDLQHSSVIITIVFTDHVYIV